MDHAEDFAKAFQQAWNEHDMTALGALFEEDATFVNRFGHLVDGRAAIVALHEPIHRTIYSDSTLENEVVRVSRLGADVVVLHCWSRLGAGPAHPAGAHAVDTVIQVVMVRRDGTWRAKALENVTVTNPRTGEPLLRDPAEARETWLLAGRSDELTDSPLGRRVLDTPVVLFRDEAGQPSALLDRCPHGLGPLSTGYVSGDLLVCAYHGLRVDRGGHCVDARLDVAARAAAKVESFTVEERDGLLWIRLAGTVRPR